jgi:hypothetical protein
MAYSKQVDRMTERFDIFERKLLAQRRFLAWHGTYLSLEDANDKLRECAAKSMNEFYVKDIMTELVVARINVPKSECECPVPSSQNPN